MGMSREPTPATLVSADTRLINIAQAQAAAIDAPLTVVASADLRTIWRTSPAVLIGADQIAQVAGAALPRREHLYLLGQDDDHENLCHWSMPLGASVIVVPDGAKWLSRVIAGRAPGAGGGVAVAIRAGSGGVGASTLAGGLAAAAVRRSLKAALVDCDPWGGGIDLLLGAENTPGWRWDKLRGASGQIADITDMLPHVEGITLLSMERPEAAPVPAAALEAVVDCLLRTHDVVVIDAPRAGSPSAAAELGALVAHKTIMVSTSSVRSIAAARGSVGGLRTGRSGLVVRAGGTIAARDAARAVELPLVGVLPNVAVLPRLADRGLTPSLPGKWRRACTQILQWCLPERGSHEW